MCRTYCDQDVDQDVEHFVAIYYIYIKQKFVISIEITKSKQLIL